MFNIVNLHNIIIVTIIYASVPTKKPTAMITVGSFIDYTG